MIMFPMKNEYLPKMNPGFIDMMRRKANDEAEFQEYVPPMAGRDS
jgi:hypothetical protein